ncbi:hypothetical protein K1T71_011828 [Dendrolimus kikuchii]|uniref:Uncharacterized protein n=1 Tax=Dendrolimus kikuchii TaxID=765133 RepID=A0ACC1CMT5_9NEOP|nr:hypothetical protein K1T71_011828 [Dendrolimus kikuchii]
MQFSFIFIIIPVLFCSVIGGGTNEQGENIYPSVNLTEKCIECIKEVLNQTKCQESCSCNGTNKEETSTKLDIDQLIVKNLGKIKTLVEVTQDHDIMNDEGMAKRLRLEADKIFKGIIISLILFMTCASICFITACIYCCRMSYQDRKLKSDIKALAKKLKRNYHTKKPNREPLPAISESCNVVVADAGVFVC